MLRKWGCTLKLRCKAWKTNPVITSQITILDVDDNDDAAAAYDDDEIYIHCPVEIGFLQVQQLHPFRE